MADTLAREFQRLTREFRRSGSPIPISFRALMPQHKNGDSTTHQIHSYPAKLLSHIPAFVCAVPCLSEAGAVVLDPFCGSGTVLLEAILSGKSALGADSNPLARLIAKVKTTPIVT